MLDTSALIGLVERRSAAVEALVAGDRVRPVVSVITLGELQHGVQRAATPRERRVRQATIDVASELPALGLSLSTATCFGELSVQLPRRVGVVDRWIAATAWSRDLTLVTEDQDLAAAVNGCTAPGRLPPQVVVARR